MAKRLTKDDWGVSLILSDMQRIAVDDLFDAAKDIIDAGKEKINQREWAKRNMLPYIRDAAFAAIDAFYKGYKEHLRFAMMHYLDMFKRAFSHDDTKNKKRLPESVIARRSARSNANGRIRRYLISPSKERNESLISLHGCSIDQLRYRLIATMPMGYAWEDFVSGYLHVDHIIPDCLFNYVKCEDMDFKRSFSLDNLQLLPWHENLCKSDKYDGVFQPSLGF